MEIELEVVQLAVGDIADSLIKTPRQSLELTLEGIAGDKHAGFTKPADARDPGIKRGTPVRNWRQWSAVSTHELELIAKAMDISSLDPALLGANITFSGCENLTQIPKGSSIIFQSGLILTVEGENLPCLGPGEEIAKVFPQVEANTFPKAAMHLRGLVGVVYVPGMMSVGDKARVKVYSPKI